jgi:hypothetical protein
MSSARPRRVTLQHELDHLHGFAEGCTWCEDRGLVLVVDVSPGFEGMTRVAAASGLLSARRSLDKQETPGTPIPEGLCTDRNPVAGDNDGCSTHGA